jgi:hypothetical protein
MRKILRFVVILTLILALPSFAWAAGSARIDGGPAHSNNIRFNPIGLLFGVANATLDIGATDRITIGPSAAFTTRSNQGVTATGFGLGTEANFFLGNDRFTDSWIFSPSVEFASASGNGKSASGVGFGANMVYGWFYDSGFNLSLGGGIQYVSLDYSDLGLGTVSGLLPSITFTLGYAF